MNYKNHPLFTDFPLSRTATISVGDVPTPYHVYDGSGVLIGGTANLATCKKLLEKESVFPLETENGRALMGIWVVDFSEASLGAHNELQFSILVSHQPLPPLPDHPLAFLKALFTNERARMFCYRLWNAGETAVAYNRELLGLDAHQATSTIQETNNQISFSFTNLDGDMLVAGKLAKQKRTRMRVGWSMLQLLGWHATLRALRAPYLGAKVINPKGIRFNENREAQSFLAADTPVVQLFNENIHRVELGRPFADQLQFQPQFIEQFSPFRFVYLNPEVVA